MTFLLNLLNHHLSMSRHVLRFSLSSSFSAARFPAHQSWRVLLLDAKDLCFTEQSQVELCFQVRRAFGYAGTQKQLILPLLASRGCWNYLLVLEGFLWTSWDCQSGRLGLQIGVLLFLLHGLKGFCFPSCSGVLARTSGQTLGDVKVGAMAFSSFGGETSSP